MTERYERVITIAFDPGVVRRDGIDVSVKLPTVIHKMALEIRQLTDAKTLKDVFLAALDKHVETLRLLLEGYRIFAAPADFSSTSAVSVTPDLKSVDATELDEADIATEMRIGMSVTELKLIREIQDMLFLGTTDISAPVSQAVMAYYWMIDKRRKGFPSIHAVREAPPRCVELFFDPETMLIESG
ncbi:MAG: hypothetical protein ABI333_15725 [bacterium]